MIVRLDSLAGDNHKELVRFTKFSIVGTLGAVIDFGTLNLLVQLAAFPKVVANSCAFTVAVISNFIWNRLWVYPETRSDPLSGQFVQFFLVNVAGLIFNTAIFYASDQWLLGEAGALAGPVQALALNIGISHFDLAYNGAKVLSTALVLFWNFYANRVWTFSDVE